MLPATVTDRALRVGALDGSMSIETGSMNTATSGHFPLEQETADHEDLEVDAEHELDDLDGAKPRKKRRIIKVTDKKYDCPHPDCGKAYSRAEHLYRHQLNHAPKHIYRCDFPGCDRNFVRADLCARHKERHTAKGSHLQRKDAFLTHHDRRSSTSGNSTSPSASVKQTTTATIDRVFHATSEPYAASQAPLRHYGSSPNDPRASSFPDYTAVNSSHVSDMSPPVGSYSAYNGDRSMPQSMPALDRRFTYDGSYPPRPLQQYGTYDQHHNYVANSMQPLLSSPQLATPSYAGQTYASPLSTDQHLHNSSNYSALPTAHSYGYTPGYTPMSNGNRSASVLSPPVTSTDRQPSVSSRTASVLDANFFDQMATEYAMPVFGGSETPFNRSPPPTVDENFLNMLFSMNESSDVHDSPSDPDLYRAMPDVQIPLPKIEADGMTSDISLPSLSDGFDINIPQSMISEQKRERLLGYVQSFPEPRYNAGRRTKASLFVGDPKDPKHVMSLQMLKTYITSYWFHLHQQMPILHRPTFNPETCPDLLLLAMMCLGACCLERTHSLEMTQASAEWSFFVAYHMRWEIFKDPDFKPAAKLWTFQSMLLLELFEKMFSTRALHETGHVHHGTTLTVMRRGSSLIGRSAVEVPSRGQDPTRTPPGPEGSINASGQNTTDATWNRWITAEATRRAAFAAFLIDSTHAVLFGHSAIMSPHELRMPLPCDEALWSATSRAEVQQVEASLVANGLKSTTFLEGLRRTLNGQKVRTNTFGRVILMAGLQNVTWHMNQRDLQVSSLGAASTLGSQIKWRAPLTRAFDFWRKDFDESMLKNNHWLHTCHPNGTDPCPLDHREIVFEARTCLHSLAHMAMHVDIIDCQVFAGAGYAVGRLVTDNDRAAVQRRMKDQWAPSARARDAVFYALRFLCEVMIPEEELTLKRPQPHKPPTFKYSPRHDYLLNRPWVLFFATLIVWSYGYALDGPIIPSSYTLTSRELQIHDMQRYLIRMGGVASPDDLERLQNRNSCLGLLLLLQEKFEEPRWELMHEAGETLGSCISLLLPKNSGDVKR